MFILKQKKIPKSYIKARVSQNYALLGWNDKKTHKNPQKSDDEQRY